MIDAAEPSDTLAERQLAMLGELAEIGMDVARFIRAQTRAEPPPPVEGIALAYARASRAIRQTLLLQTMVAEGEAKAQATAAHAAEQRRIRSTPQYERKARVERIVERLAMAEHPDDEDKVYDLVAEAAERLDDEDLYGDILDLPMSELVTRLCKDLGLEPDWAELRQEAWMQEEQAKCDLSRQRERGTIGRANAKSRWWRGRASSTAFQIQPFGQTAPERALSDSLADISPASGRDRPGASAASRRKPR